MPDATKSLPWWAEPDPRWPAPLLDIHEAARGLASPPEIVLRLLDMLEDPRSEAKDYARVISTDPNVAARLLKVVNSAYYGLQAPVETISRAITVVGTRDLVNLVLSIKAMDTIAGFDADLLDVRRFWRHSLAVAVLSRNLAKHCDVLHPERLFVCGLLHDIGILAIYSARPDLSRISAEQATGSETELCGYEMAHLRTTHAQIGAALLRQWRLPGTMLDAIAGHHDVEADTLEAEVLYLANLLAESHADSRLLGVSGDTGVELSARMVIRDREFSPETILMAALQDSQELAAALAA